jgi:hypothetical protein
LVLTAFTKPCPGSVFSAAAATSATTSDPLRGDDLAGHLEAESLVIRHVFGLAGFEIGWCVLGVDTVEARLHQRLPVAFAPDDRVTPQYGEVPMR